MNVHAKRLPQSGDAALLLLGRDLDTKAAREQELGAIYAAVNAAAAGKPTPENETVERLWNAATEEADDIATQIAAVPARSMAGLAVKARAVKQLLDALWKDGAAEVSPGEEAVKSLIDDLLSTAADMPVPEQRGSVILDAARRIEMLWQESDRADLVHRTSEDVQQKREVNRYIELLVDRQEAEKDLIAATPAETPAEAAVQVMIAAGYIESYLGDSLDEAFARALGAKIARLLGSAFNVNVRLAGIDMDEFAGRRYGVPDADPWRVPPCLAAGQAHFAEAAE